MFSLRSCLKPGSLFAVVLALSVMAGSALAMHELSLVRVAGTSDTFWVDNAGVLHLVPTLGLRSRYFPGEAVNLITDSEFLDMPLGMNLTPNRGPNLFRVSRVIETTGPTMTRIETRYGAPPSKIIERKTIIEDRPTAVEERQVQVKSSAAPVVHVDVDKIRASNSREDELEDVEDWEDIVER